MLEEIRSFFDYRGLLDCLFVFGAQVEKASSRHRPAHGTVREGRESNGMLSQQYANFKFNAYVVIEKSVI